MFASVPVTTCSDIRVISFFRVPATTIVVFQSNSDPSYLAPLRKTMHHSNEGYCCCLYSADCCCCCSYCYDCPLHPYRSNPMIYQHSVESPFAKHDWWHHASFVSLASAPSHPSKPHETRVRVMCPMYTFRSEYQSEW